MCVYWQNDDISRVYKAAKIMERMVNQNTFDDIAQGMQTSHMLHVHTGASLHMDDLYLENWKFMYFAKFCEM